MMVSNYSIININQIETNDEEYTYHLLNRNKSKIYLYNTSFQLAKIIDLSKFSFTNKIKDKFQIEIKEKLLCTYNEKNGLTLYEFTGKKIFHINKAICCACFDKKNNYLWVVNRNDNENINILIIDYYGNIVTSLPMKDKLYQSNFIFIPLPEQNTMVISFAAGQDGAKDYFISLENAKLVVSNELPDDITFLFLIKNESQGLLVDYYSQVIYKCNYPTMVTINTFQCPKENWCMGEIHLLDDNTLILTNIYDNSYYLFDLNTMKITEAIVLQGYEPYPDGDGILCSDITQLYIKNARMVFQIEKKVNGEEQIKFLLNK